MPNTGGLGGSAQPVVGAITPLTSADVMGGYFKTEETHSNSRYLREEGLIAIPVAGPVGTPPKIVRMFAPYGIRQYRFKETKKNLPPIMPQIADTPSGDAIVSADFSVSVTLPGNQGGYLYTGEGVYTFIQPNRPFTVTTESGDTSYPGLRGDNGIAVQTADFPFPTAADFYIAAYGGWGDSDGNITMPYDDTPFNYQVDATQNPNTLWPSKDFPPNSFSGTIIH